MSATRCCQNDISANGLRCLADEHGRPPWTHQLGCWRTCLLSFSSTSSVNLHIFLSLCFVRKGGASQLFAVVPPRSGANRWSKRRVVNAESPFCRLSFTVAPPKRPPKIVGRDDTLRVCSWIIKFFCAFLLLFLVFFPIYQKLWRLQTLQNNHFGRNQRAKYVFIRSCQLTCKKDIRWDSLPVIIHFSITQKINLFSL